MHNSEKYRFYWKIDCVKVYIIRNFDNTYTKCGRFW